MKTERLTFWIAVLATVALAFGVPHAMSAMQKVSTGPAVNTTLPIVSASHAHQHRPC